jgi:3'-5' exoribonuclease 1
MKYIIVDLEATCWETKDQKNKNEIIEIGAVCINENKEEKSRFSEFVKPVLNPELSDFCIGLTSITQKDVEYADTFEKVIERFKSWINTEDEYLLCSWGHYDKVQFMNDCKLHNLDTDWLKHHISLKHQYAEINNTKKTIGMKQALKNEKLELTGTHHRGIDDAVNISKIFLARLDQWKIK